MPPSHPTYTTFGSVGLNAIACWSGWMESPDGLPLMLLHVQAPPAERTPLWTLIAPRYSTSGLLGATAANQSYQACPVRSAASGVAAVKAPPATARRQR